MAWMRTKSGKRFEVPDGLSRGGTADWAMQNYGLPPEEFGFNTERAETSGGAENFFIGMGKFLAERGVRAEGTPTDVALPEGIGAQIGHAALPVAASLAGGFAAPLGLAAIGTQAGIAGALELVREGADAGSVIEAAATAGAFTGLGNGSQRFLSGFFKNRAARKAGQALAFPRANLNSGLQSGAKFSVGAGGLNSVMRTQARAIKYQLSKVFGLADDSFSAVDEDFLNAAAVRVNQWYAKARPTRAVEVGAFKESLKAIQKKGAPFSEVDDILNMLGDDVLMDAGAWQGVQRTMRGVRAEMAKNPVWGGIKGMADDAITKLDDAAFNAGGNKAALTKANQLFKTQKILHETRAIREGAGEVPVGELINRLSADGIKGFGRSTVARGAQAQQHIIPEIRDLIKTSKTIASATRATAGGSATAGRDASFGAGFRAITSVATGKQSLGKAALEAGTGLLTRPLGLAAFGDVAEQGASRIAGRALGQSVAARDEE